MTYNKLNQKVYKWILFSKNWIGSKFTDLENVVVTFGIFGLFNYPIFYFYWRSYPVPFYDDIILRASSFILCLGLACKNFWPQFLKSYLPLFWYTSVIFCLPFYATYVLLQNPTSSDWGLNTFLGLFWLIILLDWVSFSIVIFLGIVAASLVHIVQGKDLLFPYVIKENLVNIFWVIITSLIFLRRKEDVAQEKIQSMKALAGSIAHELRTPLLSLSAMAYRLKVHLPKLIEGFEQSSLSSVHKDSVESVQEIPETMDNTTRGAFNIIDIILMNLREGENPGDFGTCSINECIDKALNDYNLSPEDKRLITWKKGQDFSFKGSPLLIKHILFNLIKNALYYVKAANKGTIQIHTASGKDYNVLHFKDTGQGIASDRLPHIFNRFYSQTRHGTGIGLAFCKEVMEGLGGFITCQSVEGAYTEFVLSFPTLKEQA